MHKQWQSIEDEYSRLAALIYHGTDSELSHSLDCMSPEQLHAAVTHIARDGQTLLHLAAVRERLDSVRTMLKNRVDVNARDGTGASPLYDCLIHNAMSSARLLINSGADVNELMSRQTGETLLHRMIKADRSLAVELLLEAGTALESKTRDGDTPLHCAARYNRPKMARVLLDHGAEINTLNHKRATPLHIAITTSSMDVAKLLVKRNASLTIKDCQGMTALHSAVAASAVELVRLMLTHNSTQINTKEALLGRTPLLMACSGSNHKMATLLLSHGADANLTTNYRRSVLHVAACSGNANVLGAVLKHCTNLNALAINNRTPLHCAVTEGKGDIVKILLQAGVNANLRDIEGNTALHMASSTGNNDILSLLLQHGVYVNATNMQQQTALHIAYMMGHEETGWILINAGCDPETLDIHESTAQAYLQEFHQKLEEEARARETSPARKTSKVRFSEPNQEQTVENVDKEAKDPVSARPEIHISNAVTNHVKQHATYPDINSEQINTVVGDMSALALSDSSLAVNGYDIEATETYNSESDKRNEQDESGAHEGSEEDDLEVQEDTITSDDGHKMRSPRAGSRKSSKSRGQRSSGGRKSSKSKGKSRTSKEENTAVCNTSADKGHHHDVKCQRKRKIGIIVVK